MGTSLTSLSVLNKGIRLAGRIQSAATSTAVRKPIQLVAYGFLVRNRRLALAIRRLGVGSAYEGRMLLRTMIEIMINYRWIRLRRRHSRALRFAAFQPLELLNVHRSMRETTDGENFARTRRNLEGQRRRQRHLFRHRDKQGKMQWSKSWASVSSLEGRLYEIKAAESPAQPDQFLYAMYSWISSAVHGGPNSVSEVLAPQQRRLKPKRQPERDPTAQFAGAAAALGFTVRAAAEDLGLKAALKAELRAYANDVQTLRQSQATARGAAQQGSSPS